MIALAAIERLLAEDAPSGDLTTTALGIGDAPARMAFRARDAMVPAGLDIAVRLVQAAGGTARLHGRDGTPAKPGDLLLTASGTAAALHRAWKSAQTLVEIASGIASATAAVAQAAAAVDPKVRVACTRKTVPGARFLSQLAVRAGGGILHRHGLSETILVFAEHRAFLPDLDLAGLAARLRAAEPEKSIAVEVHDVDAAIAAAAAGFDTVQLEKFAPEAVAAVAAAYAGLARAPLIAAAGGISPDNAAAYVAAGAGLLVTSWPYTARPRDVAVTLGPA
ncbi:ModD protein [Prosthecodimorpha staleyi]|uniref:Putative pyrophosphorylase ModD n=1 Tax=Prosthecodimorpha staleyi TaxID=2840188 RepID=A0A947D1C3_9HYPH|nr:ModD protein [Prosthecodimorpha staleyi]MBT9288534.1 ModD protein [Prosthecodimorpha staleyi]